MAAETVIIDPALDPNIDSLPFFREATHHLVGRPPYCVLPVRDQGKTHTCYAFVTTSVMYGNERKRRGESEVGAPQEYLDYIHKFSRPKKIREDERYGLSNPYPVPRTGFTCSYRTAFKYAMKHGVTPQKTYPWIGYPSSLWVSGTWDGIVKVGKRLITQDEKISLEGYRIVNGSEEVEKELLKNQPVTGCIYLTPTLKYWSGEEIFKEDPMGEHPKHAVTIVGYGGQGDEKYFICQNSYGLKWGYKGYFKVLQKLIFYTFVPVETRSPVVPSQDVSTSTSMKDDAALEDKDVDMGSHRPGKRQKLGDDDGDSEKFGD